MPFVTVTCFAPLSALPLPDEERVWAILYALRILSTSVKPCKVASSNGISLPLTCAERCWATLSRVTPGVVATLRTKRVRVKSDMPKRRNASPIFQGRQLGPPDETIEIFNRVSYVDTGGVVDCNVHCYLGSRRTLSQSGHCGTLSARSSSRSWRGRLQREYGSLRGSVRE